MTLIDPPGWGYSDLMAPGTVGWSQATSPIAQKLRVSKWRICHTPSCKKLWVFYSSLVFFFFPASKFDFWKYGIKILCVSCTFLYMRACFIYVLLLLICYIPELLALVRLCIQDQGLARLTLAGPPSTSATPSWAVLFLSICHNVCLFTSVKLTFLEESLMLLNLLCQQALCWERWNHILVLTTLTSCHAVLTILHRRRRLWYQNHYWFS